MSKPDLLQMGAYPDWDQIPLEAAFQVHRYFEAADKPAFLAQVGPRIRAIATRGELGASAQIIAACPQLELISVYGVGYDAVDLAACRARGRLGGQGRLSAAKPGLGAASGGLGAGPDWPCGGQTAGGL
jgi:lactate dehydrogenase-like 2-hydroxyacid dehydrogenase